VIAVPAKRVLWVSDSPLLNTGLAKVGRELLRRLADRGWPEIACAGWFQTERHPRTSARPYVVHPTPKAYSAEGLDAVLAEEDPEVVVALGDPWMLEWAPALLEDEERSLVMYLTVDGQPLPRAWHSLLNSGDRLVACSQFGASVIQSSVPGAQVRCVPFGVDPGVFRPHPDRDALRRKYSASSATERSSFADRFVVGCVARNQPRKNLPLLVRAFADFARDKPEALLYLHTAATDAGGCLPDLLERYGVAANTVLPPGVTFAQGVPDPVLCDIYNLFDVMVLPTMGEGFGLQFLEAMACGIPVVATDCSAVTELLEGRGELIRVKDWITVAPYNIDQAIADEEHLIELLEKLYRDPELRAEYGRRGRAFAKTMTWDRCAEQWAELLEEVAERPTARHSAARPDVAQVGASWPLVSVVLVVHDGPVELLERCLQSVDEHLTIPSQVIVVRESEDEALGVRVNAWRRPRVIAIAGGAKTPGASGAFELALRAVQARRVVLLDSREALPTDWSQQTIDVVRDDEAGWEEFVAEAKGFNREERQGRGE